MSCMYNVGIYKPVTIDIRVCIIDLPVSDIWQYNCSSKPSIPMVLVTPPYVTSNVFFRFDFGDE